MPLPAPSEDAGPTRRQLAVLEALGPFILMPNLPTVPQPVQALSGPPLAACPAGIRALSEDDVPIGASWRGRSLVGSSLWSRCSVPCSLAHERCRVEYRHRALERRCHSSQGRRRTPTHHRLIRACRRVHSPVVSPRAISISSSMT